MTYTFIREHAGCWPVQLMCRVLGVSRSGYYDWRDRPESPRTVANGALLGEIHRLKERHHNRYGSPRMHAALRADGSARPPPTAATCCRSHPICWSRTSRQQSRTASGWLTLPTSPRARAGYTWPPFLISQHARSSVGRCATTCAPS